MTRVLLIESDRALAQAVAMECIDSGIAIRLAETLCEGVRYMMDGPVSLVLIDATLMRLPASEQLRLFDAVAPGVPVVVLMSGGASVEEAVRFRVRGFQVVAWPFEIGDVLAKVELPGRLLPPRPSAGARVEALCG